MTLAPALAQGAWLVSGAGATRRFHRALAAPRAVQEAWLRDALRRDASSAFGRAHDFASLATPRDFARRVPLQSWDDVSGWVARVRAGERRVLSCDDPTHLAPTSGSTGARKLVPFTRRLTAAFDAAVAPWMWDLARRRPALLAGPAYWSVSPLVDDEAGDASGAVPVGFADDAEYLGAGRAWLVRQAMAVPSAVRHVRDERAFWALTLLALLRRADLRLLSVWHPSFLELLVHSAGRDWPTLLDAVSSGANPWDGALPEGVPGARAAWRARPDPARASALRAVGAADWPRWWPALQVVSCWGEQAALAGWRRLAARLPHVLVQPKGLLATEAVVTVPIGDARPLAVTSHYFEFVDERGDVRGAHALERGQAYEVVVTNGGGLWRYRLGDLVECTGHLRATPTLRFLGRAGRTSDLRGEKLAEPFVAEVLRAAWADAAPVVAHLRAWDDGVAAGYELVVSGDVAEPLDRAVARIERALAANPHYALARRLGQLAPLRGTIVAPDAVHDDLRAGRARLGDAKPRVLVTTT